MILRLTEEQAAIHQARIKGARVVRLMGADEPEPVVAPKRNKYSALPTVLDNIRFASKAEARQYQHLKMLERAGKIENLKLQVTYDLCIGPTRICKYRSDFEFDQGGTHHTQDVKGYKDGGSYRMFKIKANLMKALLNIDIEEV